jgi:hypothetical protein
MFRISRISQLVVLAVCGGFALVLPVTSIGNYNLAVWGIWADPITLFEFNVNIVLPVCFFLLIVTAFQAGLLPLGHTRERHTAVIILTLYIVMLALNITSSYFIWAYGLNSFDFERIVWWL